MTTQALPIGVQSFEKLIKEGYLNLGHKDLLCKKGQELYLRYGYLLANRSINRGGLLEI